MACAMNGVAPLPDAQGANRKSAAPTVDQVASTHIGLPSGIDPLVLSCKTRNNEEGYLSYLRAGDGSIVNANHITDLSNLYAQYFLPFIDPNAIAAREALKGRRLSILDYANDSLETLQSQLGQEDRLRLEQHISAIQELEQSLEFQASCESFPAPDPAASQAPSGNEELSIARCTAVFRIAAMALKCGLSRVATVQLTPSGGNLLFEGTNITTGEHDLSHSGEDNADYVAISHWKMQRLAELLSQLDGIIEVDGSTLLDNTVVIAFSEMSESSGHRAYHLPVVVAGGGIQGSRHLRFPCSTTNAPIPSNEKSYCTDSVDTPISNLWLTAFRAVGIGEAEVASIANSTGMLNGLW